MISHFCDGCSLLTFRILAYIVLLSRYLQADLENYDLVDLKSVFDVILIDPPLQEYQRRCPGRTFNWRPWEWEEVSIKGRCHLHFQRMIFPPQFFAFFSLARGLMIEFSAASLKPLSGLMLNGHQCAENRKSSLLEASPKFYALLVFVNNVGMEIFIEKK